MTDLNDAAFYANRQKQELAMAEQAQDPAIARIHLDLAEHYAGRVRAARAQEKDRTDGRPILRLGTNDR